MTHAYDSADRLQSSGTDAGMTYDAFGRITTLPAADTANPGAVTAGTATLGYYVNGLVSSETQGGNQP